MKFENRQQILVIGAIAVVVLFAANKLMIDPLTNFWKTRSTRMGELSKQVKNNTSTALKTAIVRLIKSNDIRTTGTPGELALTPKGQKKVIEQIIPKLKK